MFMYYWHLFREWWKTSGCCRSLWPISEWMGQRKIDAFEPLFVCLHCDEPVIVCSGWTVCTGTQCMYGSYRICLVRSCWCVEVIDRQHAERVNILRVDIWNMPKKYQYIFNDMTDVFIKCYNGLDLCQNLSNCTWVGLFERDLEWPQNVMMSSFA